MRRWKLFAVLAISAGLMACSSGGKGTQGGLDGGISGGNGGNAVDSAPTMPAGAQYTLLCYDFTEATHIEDARQAKQTVMSRTGLRGFYVVHRTGESLLYYGYYKTYDDETQAAEYSRAQNDRAKLATLMNDNGERLFANGVTFVPIELPDPPAPTEWNLANCKGFWTLQIAIYRDSPLRKQYAVDAVRQARAMGIEAYFCHGPRDSAVYVGSWPREAVKEQEAASAQTDDPDQPLLVLSGPLRGMENNTFWTPDGRRMKVVVPRVEPVDQSLKDAIAKYPYTYINGELLGKKVAGPNNTTDVIPFPSEIAQIAHPDDENIKLEEDPGVVPVDSASKTNNGSGNGETLPPQVPGLGGMR